MEAILYIGHGSRTQQGNKRFASFIKEAMKLADEPIKEYGFLENASPSIIEAAENCIHQGANSLTVVPVLLLPGIHANEDIPAELSEVKKTYPHIKIKYGKPVGAHEKITGILLDRLEEKGFKNSREEETVLLIGHGSRDKEAAAEFDRIAEQLGSKIASTVDTGFIVSEPYFNVKMQDILKESRTKIYLVPFLLFTGRFTDKIEERASLVASLYPGSEVVFCEPTGFDDRLMLVLNERIDEAKKSQQIKG
ncbi:sirohydrochlorin chelatase [Bacillus sp. FJAT-18017]|uniref:sirohydrochlorin chelatase n=1 Tax=Bacillus sp. FJAT-18017 TaxID=1705566 RepID=UPI0006B02FE8|nr:sirohydrochlorin chelatase [Bacillus sp. FJAT-18017]